MAAESKTESDGAPEEVKGAIQREHALVDTRHDFGDIRQGRSTPQAKHIVCSHLKTYNGSTIDKTLFEDWKLRINTLEEDFLMRRFIPIYGHRYFGANGSLLSPNFNYELRTIDLGTPLAQYESIFKTRIFEISPEVVSDVDRLKVVFDRIKSAFLGRPDAPLYVTEDASPGVADILSRAYPGSVIDYATAATITDSGTSKVDPGFLKPNAEFTESESIFQADKEVRTKLSYAGGDTLQYKVGDISINVSIDIVSGPALSTLAGAIERTKVGARNASLADIVPDPTRLNALKRKFINAEQQAAFFASTKSRGDSSQYRITETLENAIREGIKVEGTPDGLKALGGFIDGQVEIEIYSHGNPRYWRVFLTKPGPANVEQYRLDTLRRSLANVLEKYNSIVNFARIDFEQLKDVAFNDFGNAISGRYQISNEEDEVKRMQGPPPDVVARRSIRIAQHAQMQVEIRIDDVNFTFIRNLFILLFAYQLNDKYIYCTGIRAAIPRPLKIFNIVSSIADDSLETTLNNLKEIVENSPREFRENKIPNVIDYNINFNNNNTFLECHFKTAREFTIPLMFSKIPRDDDITIKSIRNFYAPLRDFILQTTSNGSRFQDLAILVVEQLILASFSRRLIVIPNANIFKIFSDIFPNLSGELVNNAISVIQPSTERIRVPVLDPLTRVFESISHTRQALAKRILDIGNSKVGGKKVSVLAELRRLGKIVFNYVVFDGRRILGGVRTPMRIMQRVKKPASPTSLRTLTAPVGYKRERVLKELTSTLKFPMSKETARIAESVVRREEKRMSEESRRGPEVETLTNMSMKEAIEYVEKYEVLIHESETDLFHNRLDLYDLYKEAYAKFLTPETYSGFFNNFIEKSRLAVIDSSADGVQPFAFENLGPGGVEMFEDNGERAAPPPPAGGSHTRKRRIQMYVIRRGRKTLKRK